MNRGGIASGRRIRYLFAVVLLAALSAACQSSKPSSNGSASVSSPAGGTTSAAAASAAPGVTPKRGGTLVIAAGSDPGQLNPAITTAGGTHFVAGSLYNGLVELDKDFKPAPDLADSWTVADEAKTYTFKLHPGVKWHDGQPFTAANVKFTFEQVLLKYHGRTKAGVEPVLASIDTPDDLTVIFRFKTSYAPLLQQLNVIEAPILPKHVYEGSDPQTSAANLKPVGTGPFRFVEYKKGQQVTLERNPNYFKPGLPYLDKVVFSIIPQAATQLLAFEQGEVDYVSVPGSDVDRIGKLPGVTVGRSPAGSGGSFCVSTVIPNLQRAPLDKTDVRQALSIAIDRARMLKQVQFDQGKVARGPIASTLWAFDQSLPAYDYNAQKAGEMLDKAGLAKGGDGVRFKLSAVMPSSQAKLAEVLKENLAAVGVGMDIKALDVNEANDTVFVKRDFDLGYASYCNGPDPEIGVRRQFDSTNIKPVLFSNGAAYRNPKVDDLFTRAVAETTREKRTPLYAEIQRTAATDMPYFYLLETQGAYATPTVIKDLHPWSSSLAEYAWTEKPK